MEHITGAVQKITDTTPLCIVQAVEVDRDSNPPLELNNSWSRIIITARAVNTNLEFSDLAKEDLAEISKDAIDAFETAINASGANALGAVRKVNKLEDKVDMLEDELREKHIDRLTRGECNPQSGIAFLDIISNLERVSDHATNIAGYVKNEI